MKKMVTCDDLAKQIKKKGIENVVEIDWDSFKTMKGYSFLSLRYVDTKSPVSYRFRDEINASRAPPPDSNAAKYKPCLSVRKYPDARFDEDLKPSGPLGEPSSLFIVTSSISSFVEEEIQDAIDNGEIAVRITKKTKPNCHVVPNTKVCTAVVDAYGPNHEKHAGKPMPNPLVRLTPIGVQGEGGGYSCSFYDKIGKKYEPVEGVTEKNLYDVVGWGRTISGVCSTSRIVFSNMGISTNHKISTLVLGAQRQRGLSPEEIMSDEESEEEPIED